MTSIVHSTGSIIPKVVEGYESSRAARSIVHTILGRPDPDITLRPTGLRNGTLTLVFATAAEAQTAENALAVPQVLSLVEDGLPEVGMSFVIADGDIVRALDDQTRKVWTLEVPFQEVIV